MLPVNMCIRCEQAVFVGVKGRFFKEFGAKVDEIVSTGPDPAIVNEDVRTALRVVFMRLLVSVALCITALPLILLPSSDSYRLVPAVLIAIAIPLLLCGFLLRTGRVSATVDVATLCAAVGLAVLCLSTGGLASPFLAWAVLLPLEAVHSGQRRPPLARAIVAMAAVPVLVAAGTAVLPVADPSRAVGMLSAVFAIAGLTLYMGLAVWHMRDRAAPSTTDRATLLDRLPGLVTLHDPHGVPLSSHGTGARSLLASIGPLSAKGLVDHIHISDRIDFLQAVDRLRAGEASTAVTIRMRDRNDDAREQQFRYWHVDLAALDDDRGAFAGYVAQSRDITAEVGQRLSTEREASDMALARAGLLAAASHEVRTPLNALLGFSDLLANGSSGAPLSRKQAHYVELIRRSGRHLRAVTDAMLDLGKVDAGRYALDLEPFDLRESFEDCEAMLGADVRQSGVVLTMRVAKGQGRLTACRRSVRQILINLITNAIKFTNRGGVVTVDAAQCDGAMHITVADTGVGMCDQDIERIGTPFTRFHRDRGCAPEGAGLGLSLVKRLVGLHGGRLSIQSSPSLGTTVMVDLPLQGPDGAPLPMAGRSASVSALPPPAAADDMEDTHGHAQTA